MFEALRGLLAAPVEVAALPASLLQRFGGEPPNRLLRLLGRLLPFTTQTTPSLRVEALAQRLQLGAASMPA